MTTDKTGAPTTVTRGQDKFEIAVNGETVGLVKFVDRAQQRVFLHTEVADEYAGRGLASILVDEALKATRDEGLRVVAVCPMVAAFLDKHNEFDAIRDPISDDLVDWLESS
ncbi:GNAT family N-acetyltransferase [Mycobacterium sp.]|jgi:predicted GNAT family acetyltransferase|uniref:GNAT family N-acetyltransferase n=1 Tax=Mycobacterium sp. TaxID=1785 RepID=UPI002D4590A6|nr:GNAT family N-acetyltransferase [Mycobacterium sp.]HZA11783.1 GNAT family N-acetyltransferase [Mycobacterium sp.]